MDSIVETQDRLLRIRGTVQGVGFRPFVARLAVELGLRGWVRNDSQGVLIRAVGPERLLERLAVDVKWRAPEAARVTELEWIEGDGPGTPVVGAGFAIVESAISEDIVVTNVPVDLAPCADCRREMADQVDRRHGYVFINCTQCGPRYSIIEQLPYDRSRTTMRCFQMCPACGGEYTDPSSRRYHAEPNACPECGPALRLTDANGLLLARRDAALELAAAALLNGEVVAVKGVGGFHLMVDALNESAVTELRHRKHREEKPLAVLFRDVAMLEQWADVSTSAARLLRSPQRPIVLVPRRDAPALAPSVAPGNPWIGALLPSSPLHERLTQLVGRPVVATSANLSDEPLCTDDSEARNRLAGIAGLFLGNDRPIARPVDDSVIRSSRTDRMIMLRRSRGYAPAPFALPAALTEAVLCVGAQMKSTIAAASGRQVIVSPHIGDLDGAATQDVFRRTTEMLGKLFSTRFARVVCDKHPDYASTRFAERTGLPRVAVQHHLAHVLAVLLEHGREPDGVLGVAWDGAGYGEDGTVWGGEFIRLRGGRAERYAHLRPFRLPGGDAAVRDPRRVALSLAQPLGPETFGGLGATLGLSDGEIATLHTMLSRSVNAPWCSSVGRLFDGFGAILGLRRRNSFEGQTPLAVEIAAGRNGGGDRLPFSVRVGGTGPCLEVNWQPALEIALARKSMDVSALAAGFHRGLAAAIAEVAAAAACRTVVLSGGCFQNALLSDLAEAELRARGFRVLGARELPPNDGAISAGQALGALWNLTTVESPRSQVHEDRPSSG